MRRLISNDDFEQMEIDTATGQIFWQGKEVVTSMRLPWWVNVSAVFTGASTFGLLIVGIIALRKSP